MFLQLCLVIVFILSGASALLACDSCSIARVGREDGRVFSESTDGRWFADYLYENQNWHEKEGGEAHAIHHTGRHFHAKTTEEYHHLTIGSRLTERVTVSGRLPYVRRHSIESHSHAGAGTALLSEGLGDLQLLGDYKIIAHPDSSVSALLGVKAPTGSTREKNPDSERFEAELQPGSGSVDYLAGGAYRQGWDRARMTANAVYVLKTEGAQDYTFGDLFSTSVIGEYLLNPESDIKARVGLDANLQYEQRHRDHDATIQDSGGVTLLLGPVVSLEAGDHVSIHGSFLGPVVQDLGGIHQTLDFAWTAGAAVKW